MVVEFCRRSASNTQRSGTGERASNQPIQPNVDSPVYSVAGQVSHIPTTPELAELKQVLCYDGYLTPQNPANQHHCIGASYHRGSEDTAYSEDDQQQNRQRLIDCFPQAQWAKEVDVSDKEARCGVRCATRDHLPMVGNVPDYEATLVEYASLAEQKDEAVSAPVFDDLFMFAALGSRGLCSARCVPRFWRRR